MGAYGLGTRLSSPGRTSHGWADAVCGLTGAESLIRRLVVLHFLGKVERRPIVFVFQICLCHLLGGGRRRGDAFGVKTRHDGVPGEIRTLNLGLRRAALFPVELREH